jgi:hypothetical protein
VRLQAHGRCALLRRDAFEAVSGFLPPSSRARRTAARAAILCVALVAGCALFGEDKKPPPCPRVALLPEAATLTRFADGPGRDIIDIVYRAEIADVRRTCEHDLEEETGEGMLDMEILVEILVERGPANSDRKADIGYKITVVDADRRDRDWAVFFETLEFPANRSRIRWTDEPRHLHIPLAAGQTGANFDVYVTLDRTRAEVEYNRDQGLGGRP